MVFPQGPFLAIATALYSFISFGGFIGNLLIIVTILRWKEMRTPCNFLIMNIAIADLAVAFVAAPLRILEIYYHWPFGEFMCKFLTPLQDVFVCVSVVTHTTIALERYRAIVKPMMKKITLTVTRAVICVTWFSCYFATALPIAVISGIQPYNGKMFCVINFPSTTFRQFFQVYLVVVFIVLPISVQIWAYVKNIPHDRRETLRWQKRSFDLARDKRRNSLVRTLIILVVVFQVCYIPRGILMTIREFSDLSNSRVFMYMDVFALILYYMKHVLNPLIIFASSSDFRSHLRKT
ncbi:unnamed protein product [Pocillopora meandrina]|uniref:G-protein coupled receptors family 1 profile domain-containing protein n=1 Tax=Pocillopora meandrina TaxID=46732 RepID=A0AAU9W281_9CNID|nr:unnamed protein product [Pocillopora meandrina]